MKICPTCQHAYSDDVEFRPRDGAHLAAQATETQAQLAADLARRFCIVRRLGAGAMGTVLCRAERRSAQGRAPLAPTPPWRLALKVLNREGFAFSCYSSLVTRHSSLPLCPRLPAALSE